MNGERDLQALIRTMQPELRPGRFVFVTVPQAPEGIAAVAMVSEDEGVTLVLDQAQADRLGLAYHFVAAMITLRVHSSLEAVGLTAAVAGALTAAGISCNVIAGYFHDHLFVPIETTATAMAALRALMTAEPGSQGTGTGL